MPMTARTISTRAPLFHLGALGVTSHGLEWATIGLGVAVILGWVQSLKQADRPTYKLLWGNPQMISMTVASALYMTQTYGLTTFSAKYAITHFHATPGSHITVAKLSRV